MKAKSLLTVVAVSTLLAVNAPADEARVAAYTAQLRAVRVTEVPRETAKFVTAEKAEARVAAAADAVTAAVSVNSPAAPLVVGAVSKAAPETAATAAATALKLEPKSVGMITKAAVSGAPSQIEAIVSAMCKAQPTAFYQIGVSAADAAPKSSDKVLPAITAALPALKPLVARAESDFAAAKRTASLALVLKAAAKNRRNRSSPRNRKQPWRRRLVLMRRGHRPFCCRPLCRADLRHPKSLVIMCPRHRRRDVFIRRREAGVFEM